MKKKKYSQTDKDVIYQSEISRFRRFLRKANWTFCNSCIDKVVNNITKLWIQINFRKKKQTKNWRMSFKIRPILLGTILFGRIKKGRKTPRLSQLYDLSLNFTIAWQWNYLDDTSGRRLMLHTHLYRCGAENIRNIQQKSEVDGL